MSITAVSTNVAQLQNSPDVPLSSRLPVRTLDQDDFLQLVVAQMANQDPMNPKSDTDFIAQMTQFTTLEQSKSMQSDIARLRSDQQLLQANALIGREVVLEDAQGALVAGSVSAVRVVEGTPSIVVDGQAYDLSALRSIEPAVDSTQR